MGEHRLRLPVSAVSFRAFSATAPRLMVLATAFIAAQALFDTNRSLFCAVIGVRGHTFGFKQCAGVKMQDAFGSEAEAISANRRMT
jgi:hypothetical protein